MKLFLTPVPMALVLLACSSGSYQGPPPEDGGTPVVTDDAGDASTSDTGPVTVDGSGGDDANPRATACTSPPFVAFKAHLLEITDLGTTQPLAGGAIGFTTCAGFTLTTNAAGVAETRVTQGLAYSPFFSEPTHISMIGAESPAASDADVTIALPRVTAAAVLPGYDKTKAMLQIVLVAKGTAPCDAVDGVALLVTGHPEAQVKYMSAGWPKDTAPAAGTSSIGSNVFFSGMSGGVTVQVTGTKTGCTVTTVSSAQTGKFQLVNADVTVGTAIITN